MFKIKGAERGTAGMTTVPKKDMPAHWLVYFMVADADATIAKCTKLGGKIANPVESAPNVGRFAVLKDPQGVAFAILQPQPGM